MRLVLFLTLFIAATIGLGTISILPSNAQDHQNTLSSCPIMLFNNTGDTVNVFDNQTSLIPIKQSLTKPIGLLNHPSGFEVTFTHQCTTYRLTGNNCSNLIGPIMLDIKTLLWFANVCRGKNKGIDTIELHNNTGRMLKVLWCLTKLVPHGPVQQINPDQKISFDARHIVSKKGSDQKEGAQATLLISENGHSYKIEIPRYTYTDGKITTTTDQRSYTLCAQTIILLENGFSIEKIG